MKFKVGLIQLESALGEKEQNLKLAIELIIQAAAEGANIVCLPELFLTGYNLNVLGGRLRELADTVDGGAVKTLCDTAKQLGVYIVAPLILQREGAELLDNAAVLIDDGGRVQGAYCKNHTFGGENGEGRFFAAHGEYPVFETKYGTIGILICYDANFPEPARILALKGAQVLFMPAAWRVQEQDIWHLVTAARANENTVYLAAVNAWQESGDLFLFGESKLLDPRGHTVGQIDAPGSSVLVEEVDIDKLHEMRGSMPWLCDRHPEGYAEISKI